MFVSYVCIPTFVPLQVEEDDDDDDDDLGDDVDVEED